MLLSKALVNISTSYYELLMGRRWNNFASNDNLSLYASYVREK